MKIKILSKGNYELLEKEVNEVLSKYKNEDIIDIKFDTKERFAGYSVMIIFK